MWLVKFTLLGLIGQITCAPAEQWPPEGTYPKTVLKHHNVHRFNHSAKALTWSENLRKSAQILANRCVFAHDLSINGGGYGQNLAAGLEKSHISEAITTLFYNNEMPQFAGKYGQANPTDFYSWGHFTQVVWKGTKKVACVTSDCTKKGLRDANGKILPYPQYLTSCHYSPPGNYGGEYAKNVGRPLGKPFVGPQF